MKIWLIRHGLTRPGEEKRYQGTTDEGLSDRGRRELQRADILYPDDFRVPRSWQSAAADAGDAGLPGYGKSGQDPFAAPNPVFPSHVYVSPALRARETAGILFPRAEQTVIRDLREMDFGVFEGRGWWEMSEDESYRRWVDGGCLGRCPGGEDRASFSRRIRSAFREILAAEDGHDPAAEKRIVIVAHGGTQMALLEAYGRPARDYFDWQTPCGCGWLLQMEEKTGILTVLEKTSFIATGRSDRP